MNVVDKLKRGHEIVMQTLETFPEIAVETAGACGRWSVKDIVAHLLSYEQVLPDVLSIVAGAASTPSLDRLNELGDQFNDIEVSRYKTKTLSEVLLEFNAVHARSLSLAIQISPEMFCRTATLPWYGNDYALDDFLVQHYYGHKREHGAQIAAFGDILKGESPRPQDVLTAETLKVTELFENAINRRDIDAVMALMTDDCVFENTSPPPDGKRYEGQKAVRAFWEVLFQSTPHADFQTEDTFVYGNQCVARWIYRWNNSTGESGHIRGIDVIRVQNGKVSENFSYVKG